MQKYLYARIPDHVHRYVLRRSAEKGVSAAEYIRQLIEQDAQDLLTSANVPANNGDITTDNGELS
jgi:hypothetical protein